jgi:hypothetical protein
VKALFIAWQDSDSRRWLPVGRLTRENGLYTFAYTRGAILASDFKPFGKMDKLDVSYSSSELFPIFANRVLAKNRPEYDDYLRWLGLSDVKYDDLEELSRTGGLRATDSIELFPCPLPTESNTYEVYFFCRGLRYLHAENLVRADSLKLGERLFLMQDLQNAADPMALLMRTCDPVTLVGYAPRYYSAEFTNLIQKLQSDQVKVTVEQVNLDAPIQYRVLCKLSCPWPSGFEPFSDDEFKTLAQIPVSN